MIRLDPLASLAWLLLLLPATASGPATAAPLQDQEPRARAEDVEAALRDGDYERAHALLTRLLVDQRLDRAAAEQQAGRPEAAWEALQRALELAPAAPRARALRVELAKELLGRWLDEARAMLLAGEPRDAMVVLDEAVALAPDDERVQFLRGESVLRMGVEDGNVFAFEDARRGFQAARGLAAADSGAARALYLAYFDSGERAQLDRALELARQGAEATPADDPWAAALSSPPLRTLAEIAFQVYTVDKLEQQPAELVARRFDESRAAYESLIADAPEDPWAWRQLANLLAWEGRHDEAHDLLLRALEIAPGEPALHEALIGAAEQIGGVEQAVSTYARWVEAHPEVGLGRWWLGVKRLALAVQRIQQGELDVEEPLAAAEAEFERCAELLPEYATTCAGYRALCRSALGRSRMERGELAGAQEALRSMESLLEGGLTWQYPGLWGGNGQPETGVLGLQRLIGRYMRTAANDALPAEERDAALEEAARIATFLSGYRPDDANLANDAGFLSRDAGVALAQRGELLLRRAAGIGDRAADLSDEERAAARGRAEELLARAVQHMEASHAAYARAAELAPEDARILNDTALILIHYLQRDLEAAERLLERSIEVGTARLEAGGLSDEERTALTEAVGDAHENRGTLLLTLRGDAAAAVPWFERALALGPYPRPIVSSRHLPLCAAVQAGEVDVDTVKAAAYWGRLEPEKVLERVRADDRLRRFLRGERQ